ncbi:MAG TPA: winged helix-turn-helix domain-containing protein [Pyrinomonadaceae bacterium]|nr:winged helix-turn-helix domain-containing protein [Pyrinomonadaceae bacterium]
MDLTLKNAEFNFNVTADEQNTVYEFEDFRLDTATKLLFRSGEQIVLTPRAVETLIALVEGQGKVINKDDLIKRIWPDTIVEESNLAQYLHILRKTLGETSDGKPFIETLKRRGYRFNGKVRVLQAGNGISRPLEEAEPFQTSNPAVPNSGSRRVEGRGNAHALSQVAAEREVAHHVKVERSDNVYSVSDWRREPIVDTSLAVDQPTRSRWLLPLVLVILVAGLAGISFAVYKFTSGGPTAETRSIPFSGSAMTRITTTGNSKVAAISPDGLYLAHVTAGTDGDTLWVRQVTVANDTRIAGPTKSVLVSVTFAPDGNFVYYLASAMDKGETELFRVPVLGGPIVKVLTDIAPPTFSPDGTRIAYMRTHKEESGLFIANADGTNESMLLSRRDPDYLNMFWYAPAWSPDGKSIAVPAGQGDETGRYETVLAVDVETAAERKLTNTRWQQVGQPRWLADGLIVSASETSTAPQQLWHISLPDGTASRITRDLNNYKEVSLTSDTKTLTVIQDHGVSNIWTAGGDGAGAKQILSEAGRLNEIIWLPDGRLAYTSNASGSSDVWTMNADGSNVQQLTMGANARLGLAVTADQTQLVFAAEHEGKFNLWRVDIDGANLTRITNGDGEYYPQCTPDGRWIVYQSGGNRPTLWKMPAAGGPGEAITKNTASRPSLSPDGKFVAYHYLDWTFEKGRWSIGIISLEDGKQVKRFDFPSTATERLVKWTRDGKAIAFLNSPDGVPNIWLQPIDGGDIKPLTDFPSDNIIAFNWNAEGTHLAVIRGVETSDVVLINQASVK